VDIFGHKGRMKTFLDKRPAALNLVVATATTLYQSSIRQ
jgi:hypothetical protein